MRHTGGTAFGETSTRSRPRSRAILSASNGCMMPSCSPWSSMTRTSRARILSLVRMNDFAERLSRAMGILQIVRGHTLAGRVYHWVLRLPLGDTAKEPVDTCLDVGAQHAV